MKNQLYIYNQKGFSLIEVVIAATLASFVGLGISTLTVNQHRSVSRLDDRISYQNFGKELVDLLEGQVSCQNTINDIVVPVALASNAPNVATNLTEIRDDADQVVYNTTDRNVFDGLRIRSIQLKNQDLTGALTEGRTLIEVQVERIRTPAGQTPERLSPIILEKQVTIDANRRITSCLSSESGLGELPCITTFRNVKPYVTSGFNSAPIEPSHTIPSDAKYMTFTIPSRTETYDANNEGQNCNNADRSCSDSDMTTRTIPGLNIVVALGKTKLLTGQVIEAGGRITMSGDDAFYNGRQLFIKGTGSSTSPHRSFVARSQISNLPICDYDGFNASERFVYSK